MTTLENIQEAIKKNLSAEVGDALRKRLNEADADLKALEVLHKRLAELELVAKEVQSDKQRAKQIEMLEEKEKALRRAETDKYIITLREQSAKDREAFALRVLEIVFSNNVYKYRTTETGNLPIPASQPGTYPSTMPYNREASGVGEGAPPPPPTDKP
jgi:hypothetical protein